MKKKNNRSVSGKRPSDKRWSFNTNSIIRVKLTKMGYQRLADRHNESSGLAPKSAAYFREFADDDGYTTFQMWEFMQNFGPVCRWGGQHYYDCDILISDRDLQPDK